MSKTSTTRPKSPTKRPHRRVSKASAQEPGSVARAKAPSRPRRANTRTSGNDHGAKQRPNKQEACLEFLGRAEGASIEELQALTGWQAHSVRGFLAGAVKRKLGLALSSDKAAGQSRRYRLATRS